MPEKPAEPARARGFWTGTIAFALVSVPVSLFTATRSSRVSLRMVDDSGQPLRRVYFCSREEKPLDRDDIVRGYEIEKDRYVVVEDEELAAIAPEKSQEINLERFVEVKDIDPVYFERAYFLAPGRGGARPYRLLARAMEQSGRAGIATFVMRGKEYLVAIIAERGLLRAETLRFHDELRTPAGMGLPETAKPDAGAVKQMERVMRKLHAEELDRDALSDQQVHLLEELVQEKLRRGQDVVSADETAEPSERESAEIIDLMHVLKQSVEERRTGNGGHRSRRRGSAATRRKAPARSSKTARGGSPLDKRSKAALYEEAQRLDIAGRSNMTKDELIDALRGAR